MKNVLIICCIAVFTFCSCDSGSSEPDSSEFETNFEQGPELTDLVESTVLLDGEEITIYTDEDKGELLSMKDGELVNVEQLSESGNLGFYASPDFEGFVMFSTREKLNEILKVPSKVDKLHQKMSALNPTKGDVIELEKGSSALAAITPKFTIASGSNLGGFVFSKNTPTLVITWYSNPHLRCNQFETGCINFNDNISSVKVENAIAEFYKGSFTSSGSWLYINAFGGIYQNNNLSAAGFNDNITSFWVDSQSRASGNRIGMLTSLANCGHNYNDPACP